MCISQKSLNQSISNFLPTFCLNLKNRIYFSHRPCKRTIFFSWYFFPFSIFACFLRRSMLFRQIWCDFKHFKQDRYLPVLQKVTCQNVSYLEIYLKKKHLFRHIFFLFDFCLLLFKSTPFRQI